MEQKITLVVLAAGMGSRFGGPKQETPVADDGRVILDFSVRDAQRAGFTDVVFIVREGMEEEFREAVGDRIGKGIPVSYVTQPIFDLPAGRTKPFGTAHAVLACKDTVKNPFAVINADDYYGRNAFFEIAEHLKRAKPGEYAMVAYELGKTLSKNGAVTRGVCKLKDGYLCDLAETHGIAPDGSVKYADGETVLPPDTPVSMNLFGVTPDIFAILGEEYDVFRKTADLTRDEFYIPVVICDAVKTGKATVKAYRNTDKWYGITYREDLGEVKDAIGDLIRLGYYD